MPRTSPLPRRKARLVDPPHFLAAETWAPRSEATGTRPHGRWVRLGWHRAPTSGRAARGTGGRPAAHGGVRRHSPGGPAPGIRPAGPRGALPGGPRDSPRDRPARLVCRAVQGPWLGGLARSALTPAGRGHLPVVVKEGAEVQRVGGLARGRRGNCFAPHCAGPSPCLRSGDSR